MAVARLSAEYLRERIVYDPLTGEIRWRLKTEQHEPNLRERNRWNNRHAGTRAGSVSRDKNGIPHYKLRIDWIGYHAGPLIWLYMTGEYPVGQIDHINRDGLDNRWANLRDVPQAVNLLNKSQYRSCSTGVTGVTWYPQTKRWKASVQCDKKVYQLGYFLDFDKAAAAVKAKRAELGFTEGHGTARQEAA